MGSRPLPLVILLALMGTTAFLPQPSAWSETFEQSIQKFQSQCLVKVQTKGYSSASSQTYCTCYVNGSMPILKKLHGAPMADNSPEAREAAQQLMAASTRCASHLSR